MRRVHYGVLLILCAVMAFIMASNIESRLVEVAPPPIAVATPTAPAQSDLDRLELAEQSVWKVWRHTPPGFSDSAGSCWAIRKQTLIGGGGLYVFVTNRHVLHPADGPAGYTLHRRGVTLMVAHVKAFDVEDVGLLFVQTDVEIHVLKARFSRPREGQRAVMMGYPGLVDGERFQFYMAEGLLTDQGEGASVPTWYGASGGPLVDPGTGEALAISTKITVPDGTAVPCFSRPLPLWKIEAWLREQQAVP